MAGRAATDAEMVAERQDDAAERSRTAIPTAPPQSRMRRLLTRLKVKV